MAKPDLGMKRQCQACGARFFDMNRNPIVCPKCATVFQPAPTPTRSSARNSAPVPVDDEEKEKDDGAEIVSLEDAEAGEAVPADDSEDDDDEPASDDTFLEEDENGDDVTNLIDGDIETDEEP